MYISRWENSRGHPDNVSFMQFSTKIDGFKQKDSQGFENSYNSYEQYPLEKFFIFTIYQNYTLPLTICNASPCFHYVLFADDTTIVSMHYNFDIVLDKTNEELNKLVDWFDANKLIINCDKTNVTCTSMYQIMILLMSK